MVVVEGERQPVIRVGVDHRRAGAEAVVEELDERIGAGVGGAAARVAAAAGDAEQARFVEGRAGQVVQAGVVALHVLGVGQIPGIADHGRGEVAAALDVGIEHADDRRRIDVQRDGARVAAARRRDRPRARRQVAVVPIEQAVVGEVDGLGDPFGIDLDDIARLGVGGAQHDAAAEAAPLQPADREAVAAFRQAHPVEVEGGVLHAGRPAEANLEALDQAGPRGTGGLQRHVEIDAIDLVGGAALRGLRHHVGVLRAGQRAAGLPQREAAARLRGVGEPEGGDAILDVGRADAAAGAEGQPAVAAGVDRRVDAVLADRVEGAIDALVEHLDGRGLAARDAAEDAAGLGRRARPGRGPGLVVRVHVHPVRALREVPRVAQDRRGEVSAGLARLCGCAADREGLRRSVAGEADHEKKAGRRPAQPQNCRPRHHYDMHPRAQSPAPLGRRGGTRSGRCPAGRRGAAHC